MNRKIINVSIIILIIILILCLSAISYIQLRLIDDNQENNEDYRFATDDDMALLIVTNDTTFSDMKDISVNIALTNNCTETVKIPNGIPTDFVYLKPNLTTPNGTASLINIDCEDRPYFEVVLQPSESIERTILLSNYDPWVGSTSLLNYPIPGDYYLSITYSHQQINNLTSNTIHFEIG